VISGTIVNIQKTDSSEGMKRKVSFASVDNMITEESITVGSNHNNWLRPDDDRLRPNRSSFNDGFARMSNFVLKKLSPKPSRRPPEVSLTNLKIYLKSNQLENLLETIIRTIHLF
jgi:hypothetical protein